MKEEQIKVTDLEKFVLEEVYRPYQRVLGISDETLLKSNKQYGLENARELLIKNKEWARAVLNRITKCHFYFPSYIKHPLVVFINNAQFIKWED